MTRLKAYLFHLKIKKKKNEKESNPLIAINNVLLRFSLLDIHANRSADLAVLLIMLMAGKPAAIAIQSKFHTRLRLEKSQQK